MILQANINSMIELFDNEYDVIVVGAGLSGAVVARELADKNKRVLVIERRDTISGNLLDLKDKATGFKYQRYGPHTFHTSDPKINEYIHRFGEWEPFTLKAGVSFKSVYLQTPFNFKTIDTLYPIEKATVLKNKLLEYYPNATSVSILDLFENSDEDVKLFAKYLFENDYKPYTVRQWGLKPDELDISIFKRVPIKLSYDESYLGDTYEYMPKTTFLDFITNILNHKNITVYTNCSFKKLFPNSLPTDIDVYYTGAIDELLDFKFGVLPYRSLYFKRVCDLSITSYQSQPVVAYPQNKEKNLTRITEYNKLIKQDVAGIFCMKEYSEEYVPGKNEPFYPVLNDSSKELYAKYVDEMKRYPNFHLVGRLANFKYFNMDQAIINALKSVENA